jgi:cobalt-zinc-cadmium resistance protein CzcA
MSRFLLFLVFGFLSFPLSAQRVMTPSEAVTLALNNQRNLKAASLSVQQQQQLGRSAGGLANPQVTAEASPYEPLVVGVQQALSLPGVYRNRRAVQGERIRLAQLQLQGSRLELKRDVQLSFLQLQYFTQRVTLLQYQDSIYQAIKASSQRFFSAGQINKLEELQATTQADRLRNELLRAQADLSAESQLFRFFTGYVDSIIVAPLETYTFMPASDTVTNNVQQQILQQQIAVNERQLQLERSELLPQVSAGLMFPTTKEYERAVGYQVGVSIPLWSRQNRSRVAAAQTSVEISRAQQELEQQRITAQYRQMLGNYNRELQSLDYYKRTAIPQAQSIIAVSQRLFGGGELNYVESLRNLQTAFDIFTNHLEVHRAYNEMVIQLNYLKGTL